MLLCILFIPSNVMAHVTNEKTIYDDIEFSKAKKEIVYLRGLNVIAYEKGAHLFKPQDTLTKADLAYWVGTFHKLGGHETTKEEMQKLAIEKGYIDSLEGNATYADINIAFFAGKAPVEQPDAELTKEEFALFMGRFLTEEVEGKTLFDKAGYEPGPSGTIEQVSFVMEGEGEKAYKVFTYKINGETVQVSKHPKILYGLVDLSAWEGKQIATSWMMTGENGKKEVQIIEAGEGQFTEDEIAAQGGKEEASQAIQASATEQTQVSTEERGFPIVPTVGGILLLTILGWLFMKKK